ncbi:hypothetical protein ACFFX0_32430 [Citricoccus parietis]|uniref:Uncharacterized protein n=1 Tax=Citricoccus parietis TaxID=592307 RepID=A0ABV5G9K6_9MICC
MMHLMQYLPCGPQYRWRDRPSTARQRACAGRKAVRLRGDAHRLERSAVQPRTGHTNDPQQDSGHQAVRELHGEVPVGMGPGRRRGLHDSCKVKGAPRGEIDYPCVPDDHPSLLRLPLRRTLRVGSRV